MQYNADQQIFINFKTLAWPWQSAVFSFTKAYYGVTIISLGFIYQTDLKLGLSLY